MLTTLKIPFFWYRPLIFWPHPHNSVACNTGLSSFVLPLLALKSAKSSEIQRVLAVIAGQGHPRSSIVVSIERAYATSSQLFMVTLDISPTIYALLMFKARKWLVFPTPPLRDTPLGRNLLEFLDETYRTKTKVMGLPEGENFRILTSTVFDWSTRVTDGQTDGRTGDSSALTIYAVTL